MEARYGHRSETALTPRASTSSGLLIALASNFSRGVAAGRGDMRVLVACEFSGIAHSRHGRAMGVAYNSAAWLPPSSVSASKRPYRSSDITDEVLDETVGLRRVVYTERRRIRSGRWRSALSCRAAELLQHGPRVLVRASLAVQWGGNAVSFATPMPQHLGVAVCRRRPSTLSAPAAAR